MKKLFLISIILLSVNIIFAQWTTDATQNTLLATGNADYGEICFSTNEQSGNTFIQWCNGQSNGRSPSIQKVDSLGNTLWGDNGIHISGSEFLPYSNGVAVAALADGGVVSCFADADGHCIAVKIDEEGDFEWGEEGIVALETNSCLRTQITAGHNGGFWVMAHDENSLHFRYYNSDGTPGCNQITISDDEQKVAFGQIVLDNNDNIFAVYLKEQFSMGYYYNKTLYVAKYATDGTQLSQEEQLMETVAISGQICHSACPDGMGGGYAWISHPALNELFEVYIFHFDSNGHNTISAPTGLIVSQPDSMHFHYRQTATLHPTSHDLLVAFAEADALTQSYTNFRINRVTADGTKLWSDSGLIVVPTTEDILSIPLIDAFPDGSGASIAYKVNDNSVTALGIDENGTPIWNTTVSTPANINQILLNDATSGYHNGQTILAWYGERNNTLGLYGQNLRQDGTLGISINNETSITDTNTENILLAIYQSDNYIYVNGTNIQKIELINMAGQRVKTTTTNTNSISLGNLPQGIYVVRVLTNDGKTTSKKVMVK